MIKHKQFVAGRVANVSTGVDDAAADAGRGGDGRADVGADADV